MILIIFTFRSIMKTSNDVGVKRMTDWLGIKNKVAIVTGGSSGIGASIVEELLAEGVKVANFDLSEGQLTHDNLLFSSVDVSKRESVEAGLAKVLETFGTVDALVNNAGINIPRLLVDSKEAKSEFELSDAIFDKMIAVNQKGVYLMSQAVGRVLAEKQSGVIINMSSESGLEGSEGQSCYAATKATVNSFTRS